MKTFATISVLTAVLLGVSQAAPVFEKRGCTIDNMPTLQNILKGDPDQSSGSQDSFTIATDPTDDDNMMREDALVSFTDIPAGSYGCQLEYIYSPNTDAATINATSPQLIDVYRLPENISDSPTWNSIESITGSLVGTWQFPDVDDSSVGNTTIVINSFACAPTMNFRIQFENQNISSSIVDFPTNSTGFALTYNC